MNRRTLLQAVMLAAVAVAGFPLATAKAAVPESGALERELQALTWRQFRAVIEAVPKLRAEVEAYGPVGWEFVKSKYRTHGWKNNIDRLDIAERQQLLRLIDKAKSKP